ncbi:hypothetical protein EIP86_011116 [Pleurotus ostreatoroseus]|nr:hypothetical protein EIP86_011116 [Pleurotus ostreatoroseus]
MLCMLCSLENINHCNRAILQDPATYHSPETFIPERYEGTDGHPPEPDLSYVSFGFGTRNHFAHAMMFLNIAHALAVFDIAPHGDPGADGPPLEFETGHLRYAIRGIRTTIVVR